MTEEQEVWALANGFDEILVNPELSKTDFRVDHK